VQAEIVVLCVRTNCDSGLCTFTL